jgi:hypothetical protein
VVAPESARAKRMSRGFIAFTSDAMQAAPPGSQLVTA